MNTPQYKLEVLRHYQACGSIAATAEHYGISRQSIYTWDRQHREKGEAGLQNGSRAHRSHKHQTPPDTVEKIRQLALQNPTLGGTQLAKLIVAPFTRVSAQTVNGVLRQLRLSDADDRWREIEGHLRACPMLGWDHGQTAFEQFVETRNARYRDWAMYGSRPGWGLTLGVVEVGTFGDVGQVFLSCVFDAFTCTAFGELHASPSLIDPTAALTRALDFFNKHGFPSHKIKLHNMPLITEEQQQKLMSFLGENNILIGDLFNASQTIYPKGWLPSGPPLPIEPSGFVLQFERDLKKGLFDKLDKRRSYTARALNARFSRWLKHYNLKNAVPGYPLYGVSPLAALLQAMAGAESQSPTPTAD